MGAGRPRVITEDMAEKIIEILQDGLSRKDAAMYVGLKSASSIRDEMKRNLEFSLAVKTAEVESKWYHVRRIRGGVEAWQSSAWFLERKWPKEFGRTIRELGKPKPPEVEAPTYTIKQRITGETNGQQKGSKAG